jgi:hypothetical protein
MGSLPPSFPALSPGSVLQWMEGSWSWQQRTGVGSGRPEPRSGPAWHGREHPTWPVRDTGNGNGNFRTRFEARPTAATCQGSVGHSRGVLSCKPPDFVSATINQLAILCAYVVIFWQVIREYFAIVIYCEPRPAPTNNRTRHQNTGELA